jgi:hypothetical protein
MRVVGYTVPPITTAWEENNPTCAHESVMWCPVFEADRNSEPPPPNV